MRRSAIALVCMDDIALFCRFGYSLFRSLASPSGNVCFFSTASRVSAPASSDLHYNLDGISTWHCAARPWGCAMRFGFVIFFLLSVLWVCPGQSEFATCEGSESLGEMDAGDEVVWPWFAAGVAAGVLNVAGMSSMDQPAQAVFGVSAAVIQMGGLITGCIWPRKQYVGPQNPLAIAECYRAGYVRWAEWRNVLALYAGRIIPVVLWLGWVAQP